MSIKRSNSISTVSTANTGSTMFTDAKSQFTDAQSQAEKSEKNNTAESHIQDEPPITKEESLSDEKVLNETVEITEDSKNVKTEEPKAKEAPKFVSREDKIKQIREQRRTNTNQHEQESECHSYFFSSNLIDVLDLPGWRFWVCSLCTICCNSMESSGRTAVIKSA